MENKQQAGTCAYCREESDRLFTPPLITPPDWQAVELDRGYPTSAWWHVPGEGYSGLDLFDIVVVDGMRYLRPYETPDKPICWQCWSGQVSPAELEFVVNKPIEIQFNGWRLPTWIGLQ